MFKIWDRFDMRMYHMEKIRQNEADREDRALRLTPEKVMQWTELIKTVHPTIEKGKRPCSYAPWQRVLDEILRKSPELKPLSMDTDWVSGELMYYAGDVAQPGWPDPRPDLIEFAITFLEADVMLFRSGYVKRHLIKRLQQSPLSDDHISRLNKLLRRTVIKGAGLEEYRAYCKLAAHFIVTGKLPDLVEWLEDKARGAILTSSWDYDDIWENIGTHPNLSETDISRLNEIRLFRAPRWGIFYPNFTTVVDLRIEMAGPGQKSRRNAYVMLRAIKRRLQNTPQAKTR